MGKTVEIEKELDIIIQMKWKELIDVIKSTSVDIVSFKFEVKLEENIIRELGINADIRFLVNATPNGGEIEYLYKGCEIDPIHHYIRPDDYNEVSIIQMLLECINQDTYKPNIMHLERGETEMFTE